MIKLDNYLIDSQKYYLHPSEIANILRELSEEEFDDYIKKLPKEILGDVALELPDRYLGDIIEEVSLKDLSVAVGELESDDQTDFIQELEDIDEDKAKELFDSLDIEDQEDIEKLKRYNDDQAGAYMQTEIFTANIHENIKDAIKRFKKLKEQNELENIHKLFIVSNDNKLLHSISLEDILIFDFSKSFKDVIDSQKINFLPKTARDTDDIEDVVKYVKEHDLPVIAIIDSEDNLVGRITSDDVYDIIGEQATEQMYNLAGVDDEAEVDENIVEAGKKRSIWLLLNLFTAVIASLVIGVFEDTLHSIIALAVLMPIVASMGGNAGTQTLTVVVRQLAMGDISSKDAKRAIKKEVAISLGNGILFAIVIGLIAFIWFDKALLGIVIALSMLINLLGAGFFGAVIPLFLKRINIDPAIGSTVLLTTVTDVIGFLSFLWLAKIILL